MRNIKKINYYVVSPTDSTTKDTKNTRRFKTHDTDELLPLPAQAKADVTKIGDLAKEPLHPVLSRTVIFDQEIDEQTSIALRGQIASMSAEDPESPIFLMLGSPGGGLYESFAIYDTLRFLPNPIVAICSGKVMSGGILILLACDVRLSTPNTTFMIHHGHTTLSGNVVQLEEQIKEIKSLNDRMLDVIIKQTNISREKLNAWLIKDHYMNGLDAESCGLIDKVIECLEEIQFDVVTDEESSVSN